MSVRFYKLSNDSSRFVPAKGWTDVKVKAHPRKGTRGVRQHVRWYSNTHIAQGNNADRLMDAHNLGKHYFRRIAACPFCRRYGYSEVPR